MDDLGYISNFNLQDEEFEKHLNDKLHENYFNINQFMIALATCHTVIIEQNSENKVVYQSSSPDEMALVNCARHFKYFFKDRDINNNIFLDIQGKSQTYKLLNILEYSSER
jgi:phospholipid-transporting ATPase